MTYSPKVLEIIRKLNFFLTEDDTKLNFRRNSENFIRNIGKLNFYSYVLLGISVLKNSLSIELHNLLTINVLNPISKAAYSQGRYKIQSRLYQVLTNLFLNLVYKTACPHSVDAGCELDLKNGGVIF